MTNVFELLNSSSELAIPGLIVLSTFVLEDPTTLAVSALITSGKIPLLIGLISLMIGIFLGDLGLYGLGRLIKRGFFKNKKRSFLKVGTLTIGLARFVPGMRTISFLSAGFNLYPVKKFIIITFPSSIVWTLMIFFSSNFVLKFLSAYPSWIAWGVGILTLIGLRLIEKKSKTIKALLKLFAFLMLIPLLICHHGIIYLLIRNSTNRNRIIIKSLQKYCKLGLMILDIKVLPLDKKAHTEGIIVSNHMSYIDVLCLSTLYPATYLTSVEIKYTPVLGHVCRLCGCLFTERRKAKRNFATIQNEIKAINNLLREGFLLVIFPEGTSTDGTKILPFKTSLLQSGIDAGKDFLPVTIIYSSTKVPWFGDMSFLPHLWELVQQENIQASIAISDSVSVTRETSRHELGIELHSLISKKWQKGLQHGT